MSSIPFDSKYDDKFTPGPWDTYQVDDPGDEDDGEIYITAGKKLVARLPAEVWALPEHRVEAERAAEAMSANACLIRAAPDLFDALSCLLGSLPVESFTQQPNDSLFRKDITRAFLAMDKARGK